MKSLVIGAGQIGRALADIFAEYHECHIRDVEPLDVNEIEILHIAFPYDANFVTHTKQYIEQYQPKLTVIHSSVAIGTTRLLGEGVVHSPERGRHPNLAFEMKQFPKFIGGVRQEDVGMACNYFLHCEWSVVPCSNPNITEALKLISNAHLGLEIAWRQEVDRILHGRTEEYDVWEDSYNKGHQWLGQKQLIRPRLKANPIGGHCVLPCIDILEQFYKSEAFEFVRRSNAQRHTEQKTKSSDSGARETETLSAVGH